MQRTLVLVVALGLAAVSCGGSNTLDVTGATVAATSTTVATAGTTAESSTATSLAPVSTPVTSTPASTVPSTTRPAIVPAVSAVPAPTTAPPITAAAASTSTTTTIGTLPPLTTTSRPTTTTPTGMYDDWMQITDDSDLIGVQVPAAWSDVNGELWVTWLGTGVDEAIGPSLSASPDLDLFNSTWTTPGVFIGAAPTLMLTMDEVLDTLDFSADCVYEGRDDYDDGAYVGRFDHYTACDGVSTVYVIVAQPPEQQWIALVAAQLVTEADHQAFESIVNTWSVGDLGG